MRYARKTITNILVTRRLRLMLAEGDSGGFSACYFQTDALRCIGIVPEKLYICIDYHVMLLVAIINRFNHHFCKAYKLRCLNLLFSNSNNNFSY